MSGHDGGQVLCHCACGARVRVPAKMVGRKANCPKCGRISVLRPATEGSEPPTAKQPAATAPVPRPGTSERITIACMCGVKLRVAATAAGKQVRCPKCSGLVPVPPAEGVTAAAQTDALLELEPLAPAVPASQAEPHHGVPATATGPDVTCSGCHKTFPAGTVICVDCGINLKTGRALLTTDEQGLDEAYARTEGLLTWLSWLVPVGFYPFASEAFGLRTPWVIRGFAMLTIMVSVWYFAVYTYQREENIDLARLMQWQGDPNQLPEEWTSEGITPADIRAEFGPNGMYRPSQLITHAFLHGDPLHLAGNMLFLMVLGTRVNALIGNILTLMLYPLLAVISALIDAAAAAKLPLHCSLGASGAIMGLAGMYLVFFPAHKVHMVAWIRWGYLIPIHLHMKSFAMRGFWMVMFFIAFDILYVVFGVEDNVAHWAHLGGFIAGVVIATLLLLTRVVHARGGDIFSTVLGSYAWILVGRPGRRELRLW